MSAGDSPLLPILALGGAAALGLGAFALFRASERATPPPPLPSTQLPGRVAPTPAVPVVAPLASASDSAYLLMDGEIEGTVNRLARPFLGRLYSWGGGGPAAPCPAGSAGLEGGVGWDCSGLVGAFWAALGLIPWQTSRFTTHSVSAVADRRELGSHRPGDAVLYDGHVVILLTWPGPNGDALVLSASGGGEGTNADDPGAKVKIWESWRYRSDARAVLRPKTAFTAGVSAEQAAVCLALHALLAGQPLPAGTADRDTVLRGAYGGIDAVAKVLGAA